MWNSGRLESSRATVSPRLTPRPARPPASASTRSRSCDHVSEISSSFVRTAGLSPWRSTVIRNASAMVLASVVSFSGACAVVVVLAISLVPLDSPSVRPSHGEATAGRSLR